MCHRTMRARSRPESLDSDSMGLSRRARVKVWDRCRPKK